VAFVNSLEQLRLGHQDITKWSFRHSCWLGLRPPSFLPSPHTSVSSSIHPRVVTQILTLSLCHLFFEDMALRIGQVLRGGKGKYELLEQLKGSSVFKARVLSNSSIQGEWYGSLHPCAPKINRSLSLKGCGQNCCYQRRKDCLEA
jgi:hypothetical protein